MAGCPARVSSISSLPFIPMLSLYLGFTSDAVGPIIKKTLLNPAVTLPLLLLARYTKKGEDLSILHETAFSRVKLLFYLGLARWANSYLSTGLLNNWTNDEYNWEKEIVIVTGGARGIGGNIVRLLAERNITVVVLDIIPLTYEARRSTLGIIETTFANLPASRQCPLLQVRYYLHVYYSRRGSRDP